MPLHTCSVTQSCPTLFNPMVCSSSECGNSQAGYWSGMPFPTPGDLLNPGIELTFPAFTGGFFTTSTTWEAQCPSRKPLKHSPEAPLPRGFHLLTWAGVYSHITNLSSIYYNNTQKIIIKKILRTFTNFPGLSFPFPENLTIHWLPSQVHPMNSLIRVCNCS